MERSDWYLKRNCALTPRQFWLAYLVLVLLSLAVSGMAALAHGRWEVLGFFLFEMIGVGIAFLCYARHATDHEHIALTADCLLIECVVGGELHETRLDPRATRVAQPRGSRDLIALEARGVRIKVGPLVTDARRRRFAAELQERLRVHALVA